MTQTYTGTAGTPQTHATEPVELASSEDLRAFLEYVEKSISDAMNRQTPAVKELLLEGYGDIAVTLTVQKGQLVVANVRIGTTYNLRKGREK